MIYAGEIERGKWQGACHQWVLAMVPLATAFAVPLMPLAPAPQWRLSS